MLFSTPTGAQAPPPASGATDTAAKSATPRERALGRVRGLGARILDMKDDAAKVRGLGLLGQHTCKEDPELARSFFEQAVELARPMQQEAAEEAAKVPVSRGLTGGAQRSPRSQAWETLLVQIGRCDPDLALKTAQRDEKDKEPLRDPVSDLRVAADLARQNSERAGEFARRAVSGTVTEDMLRGPLIQILWRMQENSREQADALFLATLQSLAAELRADGTRLLLLGNYLFGPPMNPDGTSPPYTMGFTVVGNVGVPSIMAPRVGISPELARKYLEVSLNILARPSVEDRQKQADYAAAFQMRHQAQRFAPELVQLFDGLMQRLTSQVPPSVPQQTPRLEQTFGSDPGSMIENFEKEQDPQRRERMRLSVLQGLLQRGEYEKARAVGSDAADKKLAEALVSLVDFREAAKSIEQGTVERARELIEKQKEPAKRVLLEVGMGALLIQQGDHNGAIQALRAAERDAALTEPRLRSTLLLAVSGPLAGVDSSEALVTLRQSVDAFNELSTSGEVSLNLASGPVVPPANRAPSVAYIDVKPSGLTQVLQSEGSQSMQTIQVKGVEDFDFTPALMKKLSVADDQVESILSGLRDETRRAAALAALAPAYLELAKKAEAAH